MKTTLIRDQVSWDRILSETPHHDIYHTYSYHKLAERNGEGEAAMFAATDGKLTVALPMLLRDIPGSNGCRDVTSVYGYAGPVTNSINLREQERASFQQAFIDFCDRTRIVSVFGRLHPLMEYQAGLLPQTMTTSPGNTVVIDLRKSEDEQLSEYKSVLKYDLRRLDREGYITSWSTTPEDRMHFIEMYNDNMRRVNASRSYFFPQTYYEDLFSSGDFETLLLIAKQGEEIAAGCMFLTCGHIVQYHLSATSGKHLRFSPAKAILDHARKYFTIQGKHFLHLGGGLGGNRDTLFDFKVAFSNEIREFHLWKYIHAPQKYAELCAERGLTTDHEGLFPVYRQSPP